MAAYHHPCTPRTQYSSYFCQTVDQTWAEPIISCVHWSRQLPIKMSNEWYRVCLGSWGLSHPWWGTFTNIFSVLFILLRAVIWRWTFSMLIQKPHRNWAPWKLRWSQWCNCASWTTKGTTCRLCGWNTNVFAIFHYGSWWTFLLDSPTHSGYRK